MIAVRARPPYAARLQDNNLIVTCSERPQVFIQTERQGEIDEEQNEMEASADSNKVPPKKPVVLVKKGTPVRSVPIPPSGSSSRPPPSQQKPVVLRPAPQTVFKPAPNNPTKLSKEQPNLSAEDKVTTPPISFNIQAGTPVTVNVNNKEVVSDGKPVM
ncbi:unnamed protein product [Nippostrongylus brasiliensis]|uniref:Uncharacterized protein n=1 Tax=Nippostrongylus brasiliensis TaxID=27835 RepID=A0A0N4Y5G7_NIPBR|nr:unnamed protein product [Nippostrongylus brasiliensis]